jgi:hypothetical protein
MSDPRSFIPPYRDDPPLQALLRHWEQEARDTAAGSSGFPLAQSHAALLATESAVLRRCARDLRRLMAGRLPFPPHEVEMPRPARLLGIAADLIRAADIPGLLPLNEDAVENGFGARWRLGPGWDVRLTVSLRPGEDGLVPEVAVAAAAPAGENLVLVAQTILLRRVTELACLIDARLRGAP